VPIRNARLNGENIHGSRSAVNGLRSIRNQRSRKQIFKQSGDNRGENRERPAKDMDMIGDATVGRHGNAAPPQGDFV
jgi:hypothetical protein